MSSRGRKSKRRRANTDAAATAAAEAPSDDEQGDTPQENLEESPQKPPSKRSRQHTTVTPPPTVTMDGDASPAAHLQGDASQPTHRYETRPRNRDRHPGKDVGLNWEEMRREKQAAAVIRARQKADEVQRKEVKTHQAEHEAQGIQELAALELQHDQDADADEEFCRKSRARGYRQPSSASDAQEPDGDGSVGSGVEYHEPLDVASETSDESSEPDLDSQPVARKKVNKPRTHAQRKADKRTKYVTLIDDARQAKAAEGSAPAHDRSSTVTGPRTTDAFRPAYKQKLIAAQQALLTPRPARSASGARPNSPGIESSPGLHDTPTPANRFVSHLALGPVASSSRSAAPPAVPLTFKSPSETVVDDIQGGLRDDDVNISRASIVGQDKGKYRQIVEIVPSEPTQPMAPPKGKKTRASKHDVPPAKSLSVTRLPQWVQDVFASKLVPTFLGYYGAQRCPFTLDPKVPSHSQLPAPPNVVALVQEIMDMLCPNKMYTLDPTERLVAIARQRVTNWRHGFLTRALKAVSTMYKEFIAKNPKATKVDVAEWVRYALDRDAGAAWWRISISSLSPEDAEPRGLLLSPCVLETLSPHFKAIKNSQLAANAPQVGAVALACAAVDVAFNCYKTGAYVAPQEPFDMTLAGDLVIQFLEDAIDPMLASKPHRFENISRAALMYASPTSERVGSGPAPTMRRRVRMVERSSSPVYDEN